MPLRAVLSATLMVCAVTSWAQGIPVLDVSNLAQAMLTVQSLQQQYQTLTQQYQTMTSQLNALTGNRGLGQILNDPSLSNFLPNQWQSVYQQVKSGQLQGISNAAQLIEQQEGMTASTPTQQRYNDTVAANKAMAMQAYQATLTRLQNIQNLMQQSDLTQDPAAKADLQNRWAAEYTMIQNEQTKLNLMSHLSEIEEKLADQQNQQSIHNQFFGASQ